MNFIRNLFKPKYVPPWWNGYTDFPTETDEIAIVMHSGIIIRLNNKTLKLIIEDNDGTYLNTRIIEMNLNYIGFTMIEKTS